MKAQQKISELISSGNTKNAILILRKRSDELEKKLMQMKTTILEKTQIIQSGISQ